MSTPIPREVPATSCKPDSTVGRVAESEKGAAKPLLRFLSDCALAGAGAALILGVVEWVDLQFQLTSVFASFAERLVMAAYSSINILMGSLIGLVLGLAIRTGAYVTAKIRSTITLGRQPRPWHELVSGLVTCVVGGALLNQQPHVYGYALSVIREAEKLSSRVVPVEKICTYLAVIGILLGCWALFTLARRCQSWGRSRRLGFLAALVLVMGVAYYVDSRIEVQQYDYSLHRTMFLLDTAVAITLVGALGSSTSRFGSANAVLHARRRMLLMVVACAVLLSCLVFTFFEFGTNQNLKTQVFYRTTQTKQNFKLAQWILDFDRDGYSSFLGGGDPDDARAGINPGAPELVGDHSDNNHIGGDLTRQAIDKWSSGFISLSSPANPGARRFNVIYIFVDTLRADHLGLYGYHRKTSPNIDKLAANSTVFENAFTPAPVTFQAVPRFMQSSYWDAQLTTWTEVLARNGYYTVLFPGRRSTLKRRIKDPNVVSAHRTGNVDGTVVTAIEMLSNAPKDKPFCAFLYSVEPHRPYKQRADFYYGSSLADLYDGEIAFSDFHYGKLFDWLETTGRINDTIVVLMSDHGESLGERGVYKHNSQLYNEQLHVPMVVHIPGEAPRRVSDYVSTIDLGSTILNAVGLKSPADYLGVSLLPLIRGEPFTHPPVYAEHVHRSTSPFFGPSEMVDPETRKYAVITQDGYKLIYNRDVYSFELFDLKSDPGEKRNLYDLMSAKAQEMRHMLGRFVDLSTQLQQPGDEIWLAPEKN